MKRVFKISSITLLAVLLSVVGCKDEFLDTPPQGVLDPGVLANQEGVEALLVAAYAMTDFWSGQGSAWYTPGSNWVYGDVYSDDAHKGTDVGDQSDMNPIERYEHDAGNVYIQWKWRNTYDAISRCNDVLRVLQQAIDAGTITSGVATQIEAEAKFLRAFQHTEAIKIFENVPYVDETVTDGLVENPGIPWAEVEVDWQFAVNNLGADPRNSEVGRATKGAAQSLYAKFLLYQGKYAEAATQLDAVISSGKYSLTPNYHFNFITDGDNNSESIFQIQASVNDGAGGGENANFGEILNFTYTGGPGECCGFDQPSVNFVNEFKTTDGTVGGGVQAGLPYLNAFGLDFNAVGDDVINDQGLASSDPFTEDTRPLDPRLDWTVGRRGIPYLDWGDHPGRDWIRDQTYGGPYSPKKMSFTKAEKGVNSNAGGWGGGSSANNYSHMRYADVLLMRAECYVEAGDLESARSLVNQVRTRAADSQYFVKEADGTTDAANYVIDTYNTTWTDQNMAREAVRTERRLELGQEGHRFFDLKRWGVAETVLNAYLAIESTKRTYLSGATFTSQYLRHPIPTIALDRSQGTLTQNPGY